MDDKRPVNLAIGTIKLPITSYISILHRVSGVVLFVAVAVLLWMLETSLASQQGFDSLASLLTKPICQAIVWISLAAVIYHLVAGIRHLVMDFGLGETLQAAHASAWLAVSVAAAGIILLTIWVFL